MLYSSFVDKKNYNISMINLFKIISPKTKKI